jgi:type IV secretory pathway VirB2 component (pilin)
MTLFKSASHDKRFGVTLLTALILCGLLTTPPAYAAQTQSGTSQLVTGAACFIVTPVYGAFKLAFAGVGTIAGGLTWLFTGGDYYSAKKVWDASQKGTYIITPDHLNGSKPIEFVGHTRP